MKKNTLFMHFCGCAWCTGHNVSDPLPDTVKRLYFCRGFNFVQRSNSKLLVASGNNILKVEWKCSGSGKFGPSKILWLCDVCKEKTKQKKQPTELNGFTLLRRDYLHRRNKECRQI